MKLYVIFVVALLTACGGSGGDGTTTTPPTVTPPPPPPTEGTELGTECEDTTLVREFADGRGGSTFEREEKSEECGYVPIEVNIVKRDGDWFKPVVIEVVDGTDPWDFEVEAGNATRTETGLEITSDGQIGTWNVTIDGEQYQYELVEPPLCENTLTDTRDKLDCEGEWVGGASASMIWYGEDDTQVVDIEIGVFRANQYCDERDEDNILQPEKCTHGTPAEEGSYTRTSVESAIEGMNEFNARSGVYIRFVLVDVVWNNGWNDIHGFGPALNAMDGIDMTIGWGPAGEYNGGQAFMPYSIYEGKRPTSGVTVHFGASGRQGSVTLHEIGHVMGLGHGVWSNPTWSYSNRGGEALPNGGSIFPEFGHGWSGRDHLGLAACDRTSTVMSYQSSFLWSNSMYSCRDDHGRDGGYWGDAAGNRDQSDEAYALNRVRYSYSLINNEHRNIESSPLPQPLREDEDRGIYIAD